MATHDSLVTALARPLARPRPLSSAALGATPLLAGDPSVPRVFDGITDWPDWSATLEGHSTSPARADLRTVKLDGGMLDPGGRSAFDDPSRAALEAPANVADHVERFRYRDQAGLEWAVLATGDRPDGWDGLAIACGREVAILKYRHRAELLRRVNRLLDRPAPSGQAPDEPRLRERTTLAHVRRWLAGLDAAIAALPSIYLCAVCEPDRIQMYAQTLAENAWGEQAFDWPDDWRNNIFEALAMLGAVEMQRVRFGTNGRRPESLVREPAGLGLRWVDSETVEIRLSPLFVEFLGEWLSPGKPASNYAQRNGTSLARTPATEDADP